MSQYFERFSDLQMVLIWGSVALTAFVIFRIFDYKNRLRYEENREKRMKNDFNLIMNIVSLFAWFAFAAFFFSRV